ncbi:hypothetical protein CENSYa_1528 [Cenarchaeum symbiosum A]|uniref:Uncharacterized protein n=1 Tax=Cenarchaeum symbiosum (strain A) TaxID=414004 RepID=A0RXT3_CENSY|nr:hypothetical protein CENSYa_1528 [Cenarchaeum symbiosum A]
MNSTDSSQLKHKDGRVDIYHDGVLYHAEYSSLFIKIFFKDKDRVDQIDIDYIIKSKNRITFELHIPEDIRVSIHDDSLDIYTVSGLFEKFTLKNNISSLEITGGFSEKTSGQPRKYAKFNGVVKTDTIDGDKKLLDGKMVFVLKGEINHACEGMF